MRQTGGTALGDISTRSSERSRAILRASKGGMIPSCSPFSSITRISRARIRSLVRMKDLAERLSIGGIGCLHGVPLRPPCLAVVKPVALAGFLADAVLVEQPDVEPDRRIERAALVHAQPGKFLVKKLAVGLAEISVRDTPVCNRPADAVDELAHGGLALGGVHLAVKIFRDDDFGGEQRPRFRH